MLIRCMHEHYIKHACIYSDNAEQIIMVSHRPFSGSKGHMSGQLIFWTDSMSIYNTQYSPVCTVEHSLYYSQTVVSGLYY